MFAPSLGRAWAVAILIFYILSLTMTALLAEDLVQAASLPTELITTIISALIGWVQIKKYNELSASYALTAHEIGLVKEQSYYISGEKDFLDFIRDAETAFSREHTQWQAREGANKQVISSQADSLIKISRIWADFFPANTSNQPI
nr:SLATT domain-containing protein [Klebsiella quasipneumoniae]